MSIRLLLVTVAAALTCQAQLHSVEISVSGLNCASCAGAVEPRLKRIRGVINAKFDFERSLATITTAADNKVTLDTIRDTLKNLGYTPGEATIVVSGEVKEGRLGLPHQPEAFTLQQHSDASGPVRIEGTVPAKSSTLQVNKIAKKE